MSACLYGFIVGKISVEFQFELLTQHSTDPKLGIVVLGWSQRTRSACVDENACKVRHVVMYMCAVHMIMYTLRMCACTVHVGSLL